MKDRKHIWVSKDSAAKAKAAATIMGMTLEAFASRALIEKTDREGIGIRSKVKKLTRKNEGSL